jgi:signal transduction histidine kinase
MGQLGADAGQSSTRLPLASLAGDRARLGDAALVVAALLYCLLTVLTHEDYTDLPGWYWPIDIGLGVLAAVSLWWTRTHPALVGALLIVPGTLSVCAGFAVLAGVYRLGSLCPPRVSTALVAVHLVFAVPYHWVAPVPGMSWLAYLIVILLLYLLSFSFGLLTRARRQVIEGIQRAALADRERYTTQLATLRRDERERIAREMHDVLAHRISLLSVHAGALEFRTAPDSDPTHRPVTASEVHNAAIVIRENAYRAVEELRELLDVLREDDTVVTELSTSRPQPKLGDVHMLVEEARKAGQHVEISIDDGALGAVRASVQRTAFRIVQEGLTNARKHAPHSPVSISITGAAGRLRITVTNPVALGVTATEIPGAGAGLAGLSERVRIDGGHLDHGLAGGVFALAGDLPAAAT